MELSNLLQSKEWEEFQNSQGKKTFRIKDALLIKNKLAFGKSYLYCPNGPKELDEEFIKETKSLAKKEKSIFIRVEPLENINIQYSPARSAQRSKRGAAIFNIRKTRSIQPPSTLILDLTKTEDRLLSEMKSKTRYNLKLAKKRGVEIEITTDPEKIDIFHKILNETTSRDQFRGHSKDYYKKMLRFFGKEGIIKLYLAKYENEYIGANIVSFFGNTASYLHGASSNKYRNVMAPYLIQWQAICDAKEKGLKYYDFWGIAPDDDPRHPWAGVTRFKKGFGGKQVNHPGTFDVVISKKWYMIYKVFRFLNRLVRK